MTDPIEIVNAYDALASATIGELRRTKRDACWTPDVILPAARACLQQGQVSLPFPTAELEEDLLLDVIREMCIAEAAAHQRTSRRH